MCHFMCRCVYAGVCGWHTIRLLRQSAVKISDVWRWVTAKKNEHFNRQFWKKNYRQRWVKTTTTMITTPLQLHDYCTLTKYIGKWKSPSSKATQPLNTGKKSGERIEKSVSGYRWQQRCLTERLKSVPFRARRAEYVKCKRNCANHTPACNALCQIIVYAYHLKWQLKQWLAKKSWMVT